MSTDLRVYEGKENWALRVTAYAASEDALGGRLGVQFTIVDRELWTKLDELATERLRTRISMFLNADPDEFTATLPYTYQRGRLDLHARFYVKDEQMMVQLGDVPVVLSRAQAEDLHEVLELRLAGDLDVEAGGEPKRIDQDGLVVK